MDGLSLPLFILTTLLTTLVVIFSWDVEKRAPLYFGLLMILETGVLGVFTDLDFFLFYIFWEIVLIPMFFIIGIWGGPRKEYASMKFLIYTHVASLVMILAIAAMYFEGGKIWATIPSVFLLLQELLLLGFSIISISCFVFRFCC